MKNSNLITAKRDKNDEFYTMLNTIEREVPYYEDYFKGKTVLCNCDDPLWSNFTKYFILRFKSLGIKQLVCTYWDKNEENSYAFVYNGQDLNGDGVISEDDIDIMIKYKAFRKRLNPDVGFVKQNEQECNKNGVYGSGDFRSKECIEYLKMADIVVTNPPFSLFREYVAQLIEYKKLFLIIGNTNAITFKEIFPLIKDNKVWIGMSPRSMDFLNPDGSTSNVNSCWYTNMEHNKRTYPQQLYKKYNSETYPKYDNYDAIEVSKVSQIPCDYNGVMGVPITFLEKYCPKQFEIVGIDRYVENNPKYGHRFTINGKEVYARILIKHLFS